MSGCYGPSLRHHLEVEVESAAWCRERGFVTVIRVHVDAKEGVIDVRGTPVPAAQREVNWVGLVRHGVSVWLGDIIDGFEVVGQTVPLCDLLVVAWFEHFLGGLVPPFCE